MQRRRRVARDRPCDHNAREDVCDLLDRKGISRIRKGVRRVRFKETPSRVFEEFIPRQEFRNHVSLRDMVADLREIADPLGDDVPRGDRARDAELHVSDKKANAPKPIATCTVCGTSFEGRGKFCNGRCRIKKWRSRT
jgi:hypothetical protein